MSGKTSSRCEISLARQILMLFALAPVVVLPPHAIALPEGGQIVAGDVSFDFDADTLDLAQTSDVAIVNWADFSIGVGEIVNIHQLGPDAALLNRVLGANPSELLGQLNANGRVLLINPNGVVVGRGASVNAMEFVASALDVADEDFLNGGDLTFAGDSTNSVLNLGTITAANGDAILIAYKVVNAGTIEAANGVAALAAGNEVMLSPEGDQRILVKTSLGSVPTDIGVENAGVIEAAQAELKAAGGNIYELAINQTGYVRATGVEHKDGRVLLTADAGSIKVDGSISAHDADGSGGEVLIGGDYRGGNEAVANALYTTVGAAAVIDVAASSTNADGGRAIVWADQQTDFAGRIDGRAGEQGGDGAFAEVSGKHTLNYTGLADLTADHGSTGMLLLDPAEAIISSAGDDQPNGIFNTAVLETNLATANVTIEASTFSNGTDTYGDITVNDAVAWTSGNSLTLKAGDNITVNADLDGGTNGTVDFALGPNGSYEPMTGNLTVHADATVTAGTVTIRANPDANPAFPGNGVDERRIGDVAFHGILKTTTLDLALNEEGVEGDITIANAANEIGTFTTSDASRTEIRDGSVTIVDGEGDLTISATFGVGFDETIQITTPGDLTLAAGSKLTASNTDIVLASTGGSFINQAGADVFVNRDSGRTLVYSDNPDDTTLDGLAFTPVYNKTLAGNAPGTISQTGNRILYSLAPTITFTAADLSRAYGSDNPDLTFTTSGLVGGDTAAQAFSGTPSLSTAAQASDDAGTAVISIAANTVVASDYGYQLAFAPGTLTINPALLTIRADDQSRSFGVANPDFTATFTGLVNGDTAASFTNLDFTTTAATSSPDGTYPITPFGAANSNYAITFTAGVLTIGSSTITIRADDFARLFGDPNPTFTGVVTAPDGFDLDLLTNLTYTTTATVESGVGTVAITPSVDALDGLSFNLIDGVLTINTRPLTIAAANASRIYGANNPDFSGVLTGLASFHTAADIVGLTYTTSATQGSDAGTYAITTATGSNPNYAITTQNGTLTVDRAPLTVTAVDAAKIYADADPTFTATNAGLVLDDGLADLGTLQVTTGTVQLTPVGTYALTPSFSTSTSLANNYAITFVPATFTINPRPLTITATSTSRTYGDANPTLAYTSSGTNPAGTTNASLGAFDDITVGTTATATSNAGTYAITPGGATNSNYVYTYVDGTLTVDPATLTVTANNATRLYGADNPTFSSTASGLKLTDTLADVVDASAITTTATAASGTGTYAITPTGALVSSNYTLNFVPATLTVNKAPLFIVPTLSSRVYGDANPDFTITATGLVNGDTAAVVSGLNFQGPAPFANVGSHTVAVLSGSAGNYDITFGNGVMNVTPRLLTITAHDFSREYGEANPTFTASFDNLASFDTTAVITGLSITTPATASSNVLSTGYGLNVTSNANRNYAITYVPGKLNITPAPLLLDLGNTARLYGDANPTPTAGIATGFKLSDTIETLGLTVVTDATVTSDVGNYFYSATTVNPNYEVNINGGTLTINPAPLSVTVDTLSRTYGADNPAAPTYLLGGLKFESDRDGAVLVTNPTNFATDVGQYAFGATVLDSNYVLDGLRGDIYVTPHLLDLVATGTRVFGDANPDAAAFTLTGNFVNGDQPDDILNLRYSTTIDPSFDVGTYDLSATSTVGLLSANYLLNSVTSSLVINPRPINVNIASVERLYGDANPEFTLVGDSNIQPAFNTVDEVVRFIGPDEQTVPGNYAVQAEIINSNYTVGTLGSGNITITPRLLTVEIANVARYYGDANPTFTATYGGHGLPDFVDASTFLDLRTIATTNATSDAGHYLISSPSSAIDTSLYHLQAYTPGILSIFPRAVTLHIGNTTYEVSPDVVLEDVVDFSDADFSVSGGNFAQGQSAASQFPDLEYFVSESPSGTPVGVAVDLNNYTAPSLAAFVSGTAPLAGVVVDDATVAEFVAPVTAAASGEEGETVEVEVVAVQIGEIAIDTSIDNSGEIFIPTTTVGTDETRVTRAITVRGGYLGANPNYVVTAVNNGVLTMRNRTQLEERIKLALEYEQMDQTIEIFSMDDFADNLGITFAGFPDMTVDMLESFLTGGGWLERGEDSLYYSIFGSANVVTPLDRAVIRAWLSDIRTNPAKRGLMGGALVAYLGDLQNIPAAERTDAQNRLAAVVAYKVQKKQQEFANTLYEKERQFEATPNASRAYYGARDTARTIETRAAVAAKDFLHYEIDNLTAAEIEILEELQNSILDGDNTSSLALLERWSAAGDGDRPRAFIDDQINGFIAELTELKNVSAQAKAAIDRGEDYGGPEGAGAGSSMSSVHDFVNMEPPYGEFLKESSFSALEAKMARYDTNADTSVLTSLGSGAAAGGAAAGTVGLNAAAVGKALFPYVVKGGSSFASKGMTVAGGGAFAFVTVAVAVAIAGTITIVQNEEQKTIYNSMVSTLSAPVDLSTIDLSPETEDIIGTDPKPEDMVKHLQKTLLVESLEEMLIGG
ncbi:MBG domain-containing protein [Synoicihabitans lomoniglobus]|uniref:MBG domain-containing protein n=1 Tax=Synoicihabitans lomoniglobus TaxID=2909285 RepID=A0AAF0CLZ5_9BACT|nr:filamentous hemagglutinin N-terminal domain-containing protein [Opitutaceae bacterium LMO-M01]WED63423.1 MBG domain-containing protein [Opitutaceae bacterium LMO-M01]